MVTDRQLRKIGMTPSSIERYRTLCVIPRLDSLNEKDSFNESSTCGGGEPPPPQQPLEVVKAASSLSFKPLLVELGIEEDMDTLKKACGDDDSTRTLLLKVSEEDMKGLGIPLVKARKLLDMIRSIEADALTNWNGEVKEPAHAHLRPGRRQSGCTVDPILIELDIAHLRNAILTTAGSLDVFDILRVTELELVERCRVPRMQARKLRRRALQAAKVKNDDTDNSSSPNNKTPTKLVVDDMVEEKGEDDSDDEVAPFDRRLKSGLSFGGTPRSSNLNRDQFSWFRRAQSNQN